MKNNDWRVRKMAVNAQKAKFEIVTLDEKEALFSEDRVDSGTLPNGIYLYEIRHGNYGVPVFLRHNVDTGFGGSILINEPLDIEGADGYIEGGLAFTGQKCSMLQYIKNLTQADTPQMGGLNQ